MKSNNALIVILGTVTLDAVGIGLVMPVLPGLLRDSTGSDAQWNEIDELARTQLT